MQKFILSLAVEVAGWNKYFTLKHRLIRANMYKSHQIIHVVS